MHQHVKDRTTIEQHSDRSIKVMRIERTAYYEALGSAAKEEGSLSPILIQREKNA